MNHTVRLFFLIITKDGSSYICRIVYIYNIPLDQFQELDPDPLIKKIFDFIEKWYL